MEPKWTRMKVKKNQQPTDTLTKAKMEETLIQCAIED